MCRDRKHALNTYRQNFELGEILQCDDNPDYPKYMVKFKSGFIDWIPHVLAVTE